MSLILEALKKIERDKQAPERGVVVLASTAWAGEPRRGTRGAWVAVLVAIATSLAVVALLRGRRAEPPPAAPASSQAPATAPRTLDAAPAPIALAPVAPAVKPAKAAAPVPAPPATPAPLRLSAIGSRDGVPVAVINDEVVQVGDVVAGATVISIGTGSVEVEVEGQRRQVTF